MRQLIQALLFLFFVTAVFCTYDVYDGGFKDADASSQAGYAAFEVTHLETYVLLALMTVQRGQYNEALTRFLAACRGAPNVPHHWNNAGMAAQHAGLHKEAIEYFKEALKLDPKYVHP